MPKSGGGFKANASAPRSPRSGETKRNQTKWKRNLRFRFMRLRFVFAGLAKPGDFADPCRFNVLGGVCFVLGCASPVRFAAAGFLLVDEDCRRVLGLAKQLSAKAARIGILPVEAVAWRPRCARQRASPRA